jgi:hypothetical protein
MRHVAAVSSCRWPLAQFPLQDSDTFDIASATPICSAAAGQSVNAGTKLAEARRGAASKQAKNL